MNAFPDEGAPRGYASLLRNRDFLKLFSAGVGSVLGGSIAQVCLVWLIFTATHSAIDIAYFGVVGTVAGVAFSLVGGTLVDRYDRRRLMILADFARAVATAGLLVVLLVSGFNLLAILLEEFVVSAFSVLFNPAEQSFLPALVTAESLPDANGLVRSSRNAAGFLGASAGGLLIVSVGSVPGVGALAAAFVASGLLISLIARRPSPGTDPTSSTAPRGHFLTDLREGFAWLYSSRGLFQLTILATFFNFFSTIFGTFLVFYSAELLHGNALVYASLLAASVAGSGIGALLVGRLRAVRYAGKAWVLPYGVASAGCVLLLTSFPSVFLAVPLNFLLGLCGGFAGTAWLTAAQLLVPSEMQGRYFGIDGLGSWVILPLGTILGGLLVATMGVGNTYLLAGAGWMLAGLLFLVPRALWRLGYPPEPLPEGRGVVEHGATA
ncbi:MAG TPA: MFS transporter [Thermoplasmata archaeon]|nr:MFS transporter [Thermoplasmata archaeon]